MSAPHKSVLRSEPLRFSKLPPLQVNVATKPAYRIDVAAYPTPDWVPTSQMMIDPALVFAIVRQESRFDPKARSHAGARGAMQIMPATARYVTKRFNLGASYDLNDPKTNLTIGQYYLKYLSEKSYINGNLVYMLAAYNAGPGNLIRWQKQFGHLKDPRQFVANIPFKETRDYIRKVMANYKMYQLKFYGHASAENDMNAGQWPALRERYAWAKGQQFAADLTSFTQ